MLVTLQVILVWLDDKEITWKRHQGATGPLLLIWMQINPGLDK